MRNFALLIASILMVSIGGCKKYPDGKLINVWPRKERIEGKWTASSVKYNSNDSTALYKNHIWEFTRNFSVILQIESVKKFGVWSTVTNDKDFQISYDDGSVELFEIRKLTKDEFWLRHKKSQVDFQLKSK